MYRNSVFRTDPFFKRDDYFQDEMDRMDRQMVDFRPFHEMAPRRVIMPERVVMPERVIMPDIPRYPSPPPPVEDRRQFTEYRPVVVDMPPMVRSKSSGDMNASYDHIWRDTIVTRTVTPTPPPVVIASPPPRPPSPKKVHSWKSSKIYTYSDDGLTEPKEFEAISETTEGPGGVKQTLNRERNSVTGQDRMQAGRYIDNRGHTVEKTKDMRSQDVKVDHDYFNMDSKDTDAFHVEWKQRQPMQPQPILRKFEWSKSDDRPLMKWQRGFSKTYDGNDLEPTFTMERRRRLSR